MERTSKELRDILLVQDTTERLLGELEQFGFRYKRVSSYRFEDSPGTACWRGLDEERGRITLYRGCNAGAVAHELGHGFHECLRRDLQLPDELGEDYAQAIRWFVEERLGWTAWRDQFQDTKQDNRVLQSCQFEWSQFVENLKNGKFLPQ